MVSFHHIYIFLKFFINNYIRSLFNNEHRQLLQSKGIVDIIQAQELEFPSWFKEKVSIFFYYFNILDIVKLSIKFTKN